MRFVVEIERFVYDRATPPIIKKLRSKGVAMHAYSVRSKGVAMHAYSVSAYYA